ncbi:MAG: hypothetical protein U9Q03_05475 [Patescibacteria group bacterium]|nr:hypothetical protein [Patescibacteria group bacterium]
MTVMDRKTFWLNCAVGAGTVALVAVIWYLAGLSYRLHPSQEYEAYAAEMRSYEAALEAYEDRLEQHNGWVKRNSRALEQRRFEEAVVGLRSVYDVRNHELRRLARTLTLLGRAKQAGDDVLVATHVSRLLVDEDSRQIVEDLEGQYLISCSNGDSGCRF